MESIQRLALNQSLTPSATNPDHLVDRTFILPVGRAGLPNQELSIKLTTDRVAREEVLSLINRRYEWRGYGSAQKLSGRHNETTFAASIDGCLVGTITLVADSRRGLAVDKTFPSEMQYFRRKQNSSLCELKKFAVDNRSNSKAVLSTLFHFVLIYGTLNFLGTDLFIEVNPRHILFYEKMLGFERVGGLKFNESVNAPSQLMWLSVAKINRNIKQSYAANAQPSLYDYFLSESQQAALTDQLVDFLQSC